MTSLWTEIPIYCSCQRHMNEILSFALRFLQANSKNSTPWYEAGEVLQKLVMTSCQQVTQIVGVNGGVYPQTAGDPPKLPCVTGQPDSTRISVYLGSVMGMSLLHICSRYFKIKESKLSDANVRLISLVSLDFQGVGDPLADGPHCLGLL